MQETDVALGQPLACAVFDIEGKLLLERGHVVRSEAMRTALLERGFLRKDATGEQEGEDDCTPRCAHDAPLMTSLVMRPSVFTGLRDLIEALGALQPRLLRGQPAAVMALREINDLLGQYASENADAALAAVQLADADETGCARPLHTALLVRLLAVAAEYPDPGPESLSAAALSLDLLLLPQAGPLRESVAADAGLPPYRPEQHPLLAAHLLRQAGVDDPVWLAAVEQHHERLDGTGSPRGLPAHALSTGTRIVTLADTYCSLIRPSPGETGLHARQALRSLFLGRGSAVDESLVALFVREVGLYPPGGLVRLASEEVAIVVARGRNTAQPEVRRLLKADTQPDPDRIRRDTADPHFAVSEALATHSYRALLRGVERLWD
jgi:hypothetical protein